MALDYVTSRDSDSEIFNLEPQHAYSPSSSANSYDSDSSNHIKKLRFDDRSKTKVSLALKEYSNMSSVPSSSNTLSLFELIKVGVIHWKEAEEVSKIVKSSSFVQKYGQIICVEPSTVHIAMATDKGFIVVFNYHQRIEFILYCGDLTLSRPKEPSSICTLSFSPDSVYIAAGMSDGLIYLWNLSEEVQSGDGIAAPATYQIHPLSDEKLSLGDKKGHSQGISITQIIFLGPSLLQLISIDSSGLAIYHLGLRRLLHTYFISSTLFDNSESNSSNRILRCERLPFGNAKQLTDDLGVIAIIEKNTLKIVSTLSLDNQHNTKLMIHFMTKIKPSKNSLNSLCWYPSMSMGSKSTNAKLAYSENGSLSIIELLNSSIPSNLSQVIANLKKKDKYIPLIPATKTCKWLASKSETIVEIKWLSSNSLCVLIEDQYSLKLKIKTIYYTSQAEEGFLTEMKSENLGIAKPIPTMVKPFNSSQKFKSYSNSFKAFKQNFLTLAHGGEANKIFFGRIPSWADNLRSLISNEDYSTALVVANSLYTLKDRGVHLLLGLPANEEEKTLILLPYLVLIMKENVQHITSNEDEQPDVEIFFDIISRLWDVADQKDLHEILESLYETIRNRRFFFSRLEPYLLSGRITNLSPVVLKSLVEFYVKNAKGDTLTEMICVLDVRTLDIDLTIQLCNEYDLRECLIYIWNFLLNDYATPLIDFLRDIETNMDNRSLSIVFTYMSYILTGRQFPTERFISQEFEDVAKDEICDILFSTGLISWPKNSPNIVQTIDVVFPYIHLLLKFDSFELLSTLNEFFEDTYLNEGKNYNRQYIVDVLLDVFEVNSFEKLDECQLAIFIARNYPKYPQFIRLSESVLGKIVDKLCSNNDSSIRHDCELALQSLLTRYDSDDDILLQKIKSAKFFNVLLNLYRSEASYSKVLEMWLEMHKQHEDRAFAHESFSVILGDCFRMTKSLTEKLNLLNVIKKNFAQLASIAIDDFVTIISKYEDTLHLEILNEQDETLQYKYLSVLFSTLDFKSCKDSQVLPFIRTYAFLLCKFDKKSLFGFLERHIGLLESNKSDFEEVKLIVEEHGEAQSMALILLCEKKYKECLRVLIDNMGTLSESPTEGLNEEFKRLLDYAMQVCETPATYEIKDENLSLNESLWLLLIESCIVIANAKVSMAANFKFYNRCVHDCFLRISDIKLNSSEKKEKSFLAIFNTFLERSTKEAAMLSNVRDILQDVFVSYSYESELLNILLRMLNEDVYKEMTIIKSSNLKGWAIKSKHCTFCSKPIFGEDIADDNYDAWECRSWNLVVQHSQSSTKKPENMAKLKPYNHTTLIFFKCSHGYHLKCIEGTNGSSAPECMVCVS